MRNFFYRFMQNIENYKLYHIIIIFTVMFIIIFLNSFYHIQQELKDIATQNRALIAKEIEYTISLWFSERVHTLESSVKYLGKKGILEDEGTLKKFIEILSYDHTSFDAIQVLIPDYYFYFNTRKINDYRENPIYIHEGTQANPILRPWFVNTKERLQTTITMLELHANFLKGLFIYVHLFREKTPFKGVLCGILKVDSLLQKINNLHFPKAYNYFVSNTEGKILTGINKAELQKNLKILSK